MPKTATRAPRHCRRCPNSPLFSQCLHSHAGRKYLAEQDADVNPSNSFHAQLQNQPTNEQQPSPRDTTPISSVAGPFLSRPLGPPTQSMIDLLLSTPVRGVTASVLAIDPQLLALTPVLATPISPATMDGSDTGTLGDELGTPMPLKTRRAMVKRPIYGLVEGVRRGNTRFSIARQRLLSGPYKDAPSSTRRFNRSMQDLVLRCEQLSAKTGCWLYLSGQHVNANLGFYNYISPRMRQEAKSQVVDAQNMFSKMYSSLLDACRVDAVKLSLQVEKSKEELGKAQQEIAEKDAEIAHLLTELAISSS